MGFYINRKKTNFWRHLPQQVDPKPSPTSEETPCEKIVGTLLGNIVFDILKSNKLRIIRDILKIKVDLVFIGGRVSKLEETFQTFLNSLVASYHSGGLGVTAHPFLPSVESSMEIIQNKLGLSCAKLRLILSILFYLE